MTLLHILLFSTFALALGLLPKLRGYGLMVLSIVVLYWLQPATPIRHLDFWLPTASLVLVVFVWALTSPPDSSTRRTAALIAGVVLLIGLTRYFLPVGWLTPSRPPDILQSLILIFSVAAISYLASGFASGRALWLSLGWYLLLALFIVLKTDVLAQWASVGLRGLTGQSAASALATDIRWLGFSYIAFRLLHVLRDKQTGRLPVLSLQEFATYALFFPALTAGPIDRAERMQKDLRAPAVDMLAGGTRLALGLFKKFALADTLALVSLNAVNAGQLNSTLWAWMVLYAYAFRIYFDFSGYTDIAIGIARLAGVKLPENFDRPYLKPNLTLFWNSWHMTLAQWFRAYFFNPVTRALRSRPLSPAVIILIGQVGTMLLIGLWHGVTWNFVAWGAWHSAGLFIHNRWNDFVKPRAAFFETRPWLKRAAHASGVLLTFHFVALGWVWFALPEMGLALRVFGKLFGM